MRKRFPWLDIAIWLIYPLSPEESDRFARFVTVLGLAEQIFGSRVEAMGYAQAEFRGRTPIALLRTDAGTRLVEDVLQQARHGFTA